MSLLFMLANVAIAQELPSVQYLDSNIFQPPIETKSMIWTEDAGIAPDGFAHATIETNYIFEPLTETGIENQFDSSSQVLKNDVIGAVAMRGLQLGVDLPFYLVNDDSPFDGQAELGDLAFDLKGGLVEYDVDNPVNIGLGARIILPTTSEDAETGGVDSVAWEARAIADTTIRNRLHLAANVGTRGVPDEIIDITGYTNQFFFRVGSGYDFVENFGASVDLAGAFAYDTDVSDQETPVQGMLGVHGRIAQNFVVRGALGSGWLPDQSGAASRFVLGVTYEPTRMLDQDLDTISDRLDACPTQAEDFDGYNDTDGCPDLDNDGDRIADTVDACPNTAEDMDGVQDADGCPEAAVKVAITVKNPEGQILEGASVMLRTNSKLVEEGDGSFTTVLEPAQYALHAEEEEYESLDTTFEVTPDENLEVSVVLQHMPKKVVTEEGKAKPSPAAEEKAKPQPKMK